MHAKTGGGQLLTGQKQQIFLGWDIVKHEHENLEFDLDSVEFMPYFNNVLFRKLLHKIYFEHFFFVLLFFFHFFFPTSPAALITDTVKCC